MRASRLFAYAQCLLFSVACSTRLQVFAPPEHDFSVMLPSTPKMSKTVDSSASIERTTRIYTSSSHGVVFTVGANDFDIQRLPKGVTAKQILDETLKAMGGSAVSQTPEADNGEIREIRFSALVESREAQGRVLVIGRRAYSVVADAPPGRLQKSLVSRFLDSFQISDTTISENRQVHVCAPGPCKHYESGGFSIDFPRVPKEAVHDGIESFATFNPPVMTVVDVYPIADGTDVKRTLAELGKAALGRWSGSLRERSSCGGGCEDTEIDGATKLGESGKVWQRVLVRGQRAYVASLFGPAELPRTEVESFLSSLHLTGD